jgi:hypothetical protein
MRKLTLLIGLLVFSGFLFPQNFSGGITAGLVGSQVGGDGYKGYNKAGIFAGGWVAYELSQRSSFMMELTYFQKGSRHNPDYDNGDFDSYIFRTNYIEIPVLYQYKLKWFVLEGGPSMGVSAGYYEEANFDVISDDPDYDRPARLTLQANVGVRFVFSQAFSFTMRFNYSTFNIRKDKNYDNGWSNGVKGQFNNALVAALYYRIGKPKK